MSSRSLKNILGLVAGDECDVILKKSAAAATAAVIANCSCDEVRWDEHGARRDSRLDGWEDCQHQTWMPATVIATLSSAARAGYLAM